MEMLEVEDGGMGRWGDRWIHRGERRAQMDASKEDDHGWMDRYIREKEDGCFSCMGQSNMFGREMGPGDLTAMSCSCSQQEHGGGRAVRGGGQHRLPRVPAPLATSHGQMAAAEGQQRPTERGRSRVPCMGSSWSASS